MMNGPEKSDSVIVALKLTNKAERSAAELVEQRTGTKGNVGQLSTCRAQNRISVTQVLARIRQQLPSTLGGSRMRESRTCGSVRGARGNSRPYRECASRKLVRSSRWKSGPSKE
jgi:hypothetical protein